MEIFACRALQTGVCSPVLIVWHANGSLIRMCARKDKQEALYFFTLILSRSGVTGNEGGKAAKSHEEILDLYNKNAGEMKKYRGLVSVFLLNDQTSNESVCNNMNPLNKNSYMKSSDMNPYVTRT